MRKIFVGHTDSVTSAVYSPDGRRIVSCSRDKTIRVCSAYNFKPIEKFPMRHMDVVNAVSCSPNGRMIASASNDRTIRIWNINTGKQIGKPLRGHSYSVTSVRYFPDGERIISGSFEEIRVWNLKTHLCNILKGFIKSNIQKCDFRNAIFNGEEN